MLSNSSHQAPRPSQIPPRDRRGHQRFEMHTEALLFDNDWQAQSCRCTDISRGGACVFSTHLHRPGKLVELWFELSDSSSIECEAEVVRRERDRMGVRFIGMDLEQMRELEWYLANAQRLD